MRRRLDDEIVRRGLAESRDEARGAIHAGRVVVGGAPGLKAETMVSPTDSIVLKGNALQFVSRGGRKLEAALDAFSLEVEGRLALDAGASTGGFTDCLLARGVDHVVAVDVGYGQLAWTLRTDPRVTAMERTNIRSVSADALPYAPDLVVADLAFTSLVSVIPVLVRFAAAEVDFVLLVKPQFEARPDEVGPGGIVTDPRVWRNSFDSVAKACVDEGLEVVGVEVSPLLGPAGNVEFLVYARRPGTPSIEAAALAQFNEAARAGSRMQRESHAEARGRVDPPANAGTG